MKLYIFNVIKPQLDKNDNLYYSDSDKVYIVADSLKQAEELFAYNIDCDCYIDNVEVEAFTDARVYSNKDVYYQLIV